MMNISKHVNSFFNSICYKVGNCLIDPGDIWEGSDAVGTVLLTHAHFDHIYGLNALFRRSPDIKVYTNETGREMLLDAKKNMSLYHEHPFVFDHHESIITVEDGEKIHFEDNIIAKAIFTPGHNPSCITWEIEDSVFTGDSYIPGIKTVTNLPGGNKKDAERSLDLIKELSLGKIIYPGHKTGI